MSSALILAAFGRGLRAGEDKLWADVAGRPLIALTLDAIAAAACFDVVVVAAPVERWSTLRDLAAARSLPALELVEGGVTRQQSIAAALERCDGREWISVHDAARPLVPPALFRAVLEAARGEGAAIAGVPFADTVKQVHDRRVEATLDRGSLVAAQTPQAFAAEVLRSAHRRAREHGIVAGDDATLVERNGVPVAVVPGDVRNFKVTLPQDLVLVRALVTQHS